MSRILQGIKILILSVLELLVVMNFTLLIIYIVTGGFEYSHLRLFKSSVEIHNLWRLVLIISVITGIIELLKHIWRMKSRLSAFNNPLYYFITVLILYVAILIPYVLHRYYSFNLTYPADLALYNQAIYNTVHGFPLATTCFGYIFHSWNLFADHCYLILLALTPIYYFFKDAGALLVIEVVIISLGAIPIFIIAKDRLKNAWIGLSISIIYLLSPNIIKSYNFEFRADYLASVFLIYAFLFLEKKRVVWLCIFTFLSIICKEDVFATTTIFGFYILACRKDLKRRFLIGGLISAFSIIYCMGAIKFVMPYFNKYTGSGFSGYRTWLESFNICDVSIKLIKNFDFKTVDSAISTIRILGYIPLFSITILPILGCLIINIVGGIYYSAEIWHSVLYIPFVFVAFILGVNRILSFIHRHSTLLIFNRIFLVYAIGVPIFIGIICFNNNIMEYYINNNLGQSIKPEIYFSFAEAAKNIPKTGTLVPQLKLLPNLSSRKEVYMWFTVINEKPDYLFTLSIPPYHSTDRKSEEGYFSNLINSGDYEELYNNNEFVIYILKQNVFRLNGPRYNFSSKEDVSPWEFNVSNVVYRYRYGIGGLYITLFFDGNSSEDEFVQVRRKLLRGIELNRYPYFEMLFKIESPEVQLIEVVFGIDMDGDEKIDAFVPRFYKRNTTGGVFTKYSLDLYKYLKGLYPGKENFVVRHIEFYPHKCWYLDCTRKPNKGWYQFWIKEIGFFNLVLKGKHSVNPVV